MLYEMALADAYGSGREYLPYSSTASHPDDPIYTNDGKTYTQHPIWAELSPGKYTDDTQMAIALANAMLERPYEDWTQEYILKHFVKQFMLDPRAGYSKKMYKFMQTAQQSIKSFSPSLGGEKGVWKQMIRDLWLTEICPTRPSYGAMMRALPLCYYSDFETVTNAAVLQASVTHSNYEATMAAVYVAAIAWLIKNHDKPRNKIFGESWYASTLPSVSMFLGIDPHSTKLSRVRSSSYEHLRAMITILYQNDDLDSILRECISVTGDVDTLAAITVGCASLRPDVWDNNLQPELHDGFNEESFGKAFLESLEASLNGLP